jgi:hypothetical protein
MRKLVRLFRQRLVVVAARGVGIERQVELVLPAKLKPRLGQRIVARLCALMALGAMDARSR